MAMRKRRGWRVVKTVAYLQSIQTKRLVMKTPKQMLKEKKTPTSPLIFGVEISPEINEN